MPHQHEDGIVLTRSELNDLLDKAVERGAIAALARIGLDDEHAGRDVRELRDFFSAYRLAKKTAIETTIKWVTRAIIGFMSAAIYLYLGGPIPGVSK